MKSRYILMSLVIALGLLLLLEGVIRVSGLVDIRRTRGWGHSFACCGDLRPNKTILSLIAPDHPYVVTTNNLGLRSRQTHDNKKNDTFRVLAIGDSFTFGPYVADDETWPARLEQFTKQKFPVLPIEVLNAGIASYTITDELSYLQDKGLALNPDLVILEVTFNDVADLRRVHRGLFKRPVDNWKHRAIQTIRNVAYDHSYLVSALVSLKNAMVTKGVVATKPQGDDDLYEAILYGEHQEFLEAYETSFVRFVNLLRIQNIPLVVLYYPEASMSSKEPLDRKDVRKIPMFIQSLAAKTQTPFFDATHALVDQDPSLIYLLPWNGHPSPAGYYLTAKHLLSFLEPLQLLPSSYVQQ